MHFFHGFHYDLSLRRFGCIEKVIKFRAWRSEVVNCFQLFSYMFLDFNFFVPFDGFVGLGGVAATSRLDVVVEAAPAGRAMFALPPLSPFPVASNFFTVAYQLAEIFDALHVLGVYARTTPFTSIRIIPTIYYTETFHKFFLIKIIKEITRDIFGV